LVVNEVYSERIVVAEHGLTISRIVQYGEPQYNLSATPIHDMLVRLPIGTRDISMIPTCGVRSLLTHGFPNRTDSTKTALAPGNTPATLIE
jgi:hypothetical protein